MRNRVYGPCELSVGIDDSGHDPVILKCGQPGKQYEVGLLPWGIVMCDAHAVDYLKKKT